MDARSEAFANYGEAAVLDLLVKVLPEVVGAAAAPLSAVDKMTVISADGAGVAGEVGRRQRRPGAAAVRRPDRHRRRGAAAPARWSAGPSGTDGATHVPIVTVDGETGSSNGRWPALPLAEWEATRDTLHLCTQVVGKMRMANTPLINHWWNVPLYVTARGSPRRSCRTDGPGVRDRLRLHRPSPRDRHDRRAAALDAARTAVSGRLLRRVMGLLDELGVDDADLADAGRDRRRDPLPRRRGARAPTTPTPCRRFWLALVQMERVFDEFRARFVGKASPVHLFWGGAGPGRHPLLRADRAAASRRRAQLRTGRDARGLLPRGEQRRLLARRPAGRACSTPTPTRSRPATGTRRSRRRGPLRRRPRRVRPAVRGGPHGGRPRRGAARVPAEHLRGGGRPRPLGPAWRRISPPSTPQPGASRRRAVRRSPAATRCWPRPPTR